MVHQYHSDVDLEAVNTVIGKKMGRVSWALISDAASLIQGMVLVPLFLTYLISQPQCQEYNPQLNINE